LCRVEQHRFVLQPVSGTDLNNFNLGHLRPFWLRTLI
jgi:hypothetical protein